MTLILDAGALIAHDRGNRTVHAFLSAARIDGIGVSTTSGVVAQVWRADARQAKLARLLDEIEEFELTRVQARAIGALLRRSGTRDAIDASLVEISKNGDEILTGDPSDIRLLVEASGKLVAVTPI